MVIHLGDSRLGKHPVEKIATYLSSIKLHEGEKFRRDLILDSAKAPETEFGEPAGTRKNVL